MVGDLGLHGETATGLVLGTLEGGTTLSFASVSGKDVAQGKQRRSCGFLCVYIFSPLYFLDLSGRSYLVRYYDWNREFPYSIS